MKYKHDIRRINKTYLGDLIIYKIVDGVYEARRIIENYKIKLMASPLSWFRNARKEMLGQLNVQRKLDGIAQS